MAIERITTMEGAAVPLRGDNIDTDRIIPARFLRSVSFDGLEHHLFEDDRQQAGSEHPFSRTDYAGAKLMFVEKNFGCGSSREHAPQAIRRRGVRAVVGVSFSEIFFGNAVAMGLPCVSVSATDGRQLIDAAEAGPSTVFRLDLAEMTVGCAEFTVPVTMPSAARDSFLNGTWDATSLLLERYEEVETVASRLPYLRP